MIKIFCYITEVGDASEWISLEEAAKRCKQSLPELLESIVEFKKDGWNVFINYDQLAANR